MAIPAWFWPNPPGASARGVALVPFGAGMAIPDWTTPQVWPFSGAAFGPAIVLGTGFPGLSSCAPDGTSGLSVLSYAGTFWHLASGGGILSSGSLPANDVYVGTARASGGILRYLGSAGTLWNSAASGAGSFGSTPALALVTDSTNFYTLLPAASAVGSMTSGGVSGTVGVLPVALAVPSCLAASASGGLLAVGGWSTALSLSGAAAAVLDPTDPTKMLAVGNGYALLWSAPSAQSNAWAQTQAVTGLANLVSCAWIPNGSQALACSFASGLVQTLNYTLGVLSATGTVSVTGAAGVSVTTDSLNALVVQSGQSALMPLIDTAGVWSAGTQVSGLPGVVAVLCSGAANAVVAYSGGVAPLTFAGSGTWIVGTPTALGFAPAAMAVDSFGLLYVVGSGILSVLSSALAVIGTGAFTGMPAAIAVTAGRVMVLANSTMQILGESSLIPPSWTVQQAVAAVSGLGANASLGLAQTTVFVLQTGKTNMYGLSGTPYNVAPVVSGSVAVWNGATWTPAVMGIGHHPSAIAFDSSGNVQVATVENDLWSYTSGAVLLTSGSVPQYQASGVSIGASAILASGGHIWVATSLPGVLVEAS